MLSIFLFISLIGGIHSHIYDNCESLNKQSKCLETPFCQWCNNTKMGNNSYKCIPNTKCFYDNNDCVTNTKYDRLCVMLNIFTNLSLLFILFASMIYISSFTRTILDNYFNISEYNGEALSERYKQKALILMIVNMLLFCPPIIFWIIGSIAFMYYFMFIMVLIIILSCSETTNKYYKKNKNKKNSYEQIN